MIKNLTPDQEKLANFMSDISERCYYAGWLDNLEYVLWGALINGPRAYGRGEITQEDIDALKQLSGAVNAWIVFDDDPNIEEVALDLDLWAIKFQADVHENPRLLGD